MTLLVFASGASALVFQVAWMRELRLVLGATTAAVAAVLAIFMAGLGIGSAVLGQYADRTANSLRLYGMLEVAIALGASVSPWLIAKATASYFGLGGQESLGLAGATALRLALASGVMFVPAFCMGGTLPAAVRAVTESSDAHRRALAVLYGANTLGAVFGTVATTFYALEQLGTRATLSIGCAVSFVTGIVAIWRSRAKSDNSLTSRNLPSGGSRTSDSRTAEIPIERAMPIRPRLAYATAGVLGFTFFALEMVWYRMLAPILGGTTFTFGLILSLALMGIGMGGIAYNVVFRRLQPNWSALAITCAIESLMVIVPYALGDRLAWMAADLSDASRSFGELMLAWSYVAGIVVLPVSLISGLQFPLLIALLGQGRKNVSNHLGTAYAWNTLGAIAGSLLAGFGGLPLLTAPGMWRALAVSLAALAVVILLAASRRDRRSAALVFGLSLATVVAQFAEGPTTIWRHSGIGAGRAITTASGPNVIQQWINEKRHSLIWEAEGVESSIGITRFDGLSFVVNGKSDGNSLNDAPTQIGMAILGAALHKDPKSALVIGLGTGETAGWLAEMRSIQRVDVVELEPAIDEMAYRCRDLNWNVLRHPRVRRIYNDGREFVFSTTEKYDLIVSEPSNPYRAGVASLYTEEFYQAALNRLNPDGLFVQWLQAYEVSPLTIDTVLATARSAFPHVEVWQSLPGDLQVVCSRSALRYTTDQLQARIESSAVKQALHRAWHVDDLAGLLAHFVANARWADELVTKPYVDRNTDDRTVLEFTFAKSVGRTTPFSVERWRDLLRASGMHRPEFDNSSSPVDWRQVELRRQEFIVLFWGLLERTQNPDAQDYESLEALAMFSRGDFAGAVKHWPKSPADSIQRLLLARSYAELGRPECLALISATEMQYPIEGAALRSVYHVGSGKPAAALETLESYLSQLADSPWMISAVTESALACTRDVAKADQASARRLFDRLARPLAADRLDYLRKLARVEVAIELDPPSIVEALAELEPNVPWNQEVLQARAEAYAEQKHPLANRAERDWRLFQQNQRRE